MRRRKQSASWASRRLRPGPRRRRRRAQAFQMRWRTGTARRGRPSDHSDRPPWRHLSVLLLPSPCRRRQQLASGPQPRRQPNFGRFLKFVLPELSYLLYSFYIRGARFHHKLRAISNAGKPSSSLLSSPPGREACCVEDVKGEGANNNRAHRRHVLARYVEHGSGGMCWLGSVARASQRRLLHVGRRQRTDEIRRGRWSPGLLQRARGPPACGAVCRAASSAAGRDGAANGGG